MRVEKELRPIFKIARKAGWVVVQGKKSWKFYNPLGQFVVSCSLTPSCHRALKNVVADLRRHGLDV